MYTADIFNYIYLYNNAKVTNISTDVVPRDTVYTCLYNKCAIYFKLLCEKRHITNMYGIHIHIW